jgi:hypothetical protein
MKESSMRYTVFCYYSVHVVDITANDDVVVDNGIEIIQRTMRSTFANALDLMT